jgi:hypothetical protein
MRGGRLPAPLVHLWITTSIDPLPAFHCPLHHPRPRLRPHHRGDLDFGDPRRVVPTFFECTAAERGALMALVGEVKARLAELENLRGTPDSFRPDEPATASRHTRSVANSGPNLVSHLLTTNGFVSHFWHESEKEH